MFEIEKAMENEFQHLHGTYFQMRNKQNPCTWGCQETFGIYWALEIDLCIKKLKNVKKGEK